MKATQERIAELSGKRVHVETTDFHHISGTLEGLREDLLVIKVRGQELCVRIAAVVSLDEAGPHEVEYVK